MILWQVFMSILLIGSCYGQEEAEAQGSATVMVAMEEDDFVSKERDWRYVMAWHASRHCKTGKDNCWGEDKQIRYHDVIITATTNKSPDVSVEFYIRDRYDHTKAGLSSQQVRSFFLKYESEIERDFDDKDMTLVLPEEEGMEAWLIAVIVICSVLGAALIIAVIVLAVKQQKYKKQNKTQDEIRSQIRDYNLTLDLNLSDGKLNPAYDSDNDKPTTSGSSEKVDYYNVVQSTSSRSDNGHYSDIKTAINSDNNRVSSVTLKSDDGKENELSEEVTVDITEDDKVSVL